MLCMVAMLIGRRYLTLARTLGSGLARRSTMVSLNSSICSNITAMGWSGLFGWLTLLARATPSKT